MELIYRTRNLNTAPQLKDFDTFVSFIRDPRMPDGSKGIMPQFTVRKISDQQARELYKYIGNVIAPRGVSEIPSRFDIGSLSSVRHFA